MSVTGRRQTDSGGAERFYLGASYRLTNWLDTGAPGALVKTPFEVQVKWDKGPECPFSGKTMSQCFISIDFSSFGNSERLEQVEGTNGLTLPRRGVNEYGLIIVIDSNSAIRETGESDNRYEARITVGGDGSVRTARVSPVAPKIPRDLLCELRICAFVNIDGVTAARFIKRDYYGRGDSRNLNRCFLMALDTPNMPSSGKGRWKHRNGNWLKEVGDWTPDIVEDACREGSFEFSSLDGFDGWQAYTYAIRPDFTAHLYANAQRGDAIVTESGYFAGFYDGAKVVAPSIIENAVLELARKGAANSQMNMLDTGAPFFYVQTGAASCAAVTLTPSGPNSWQDAGGYSRLDFNDCIVRYPIPISFYGGENDIAYAIGLDNGVWTARFYADARRGDGIFNGAAQIIGIHDGAKVVRIPYVGN